MASAEHVHVDRECDNADMPIVGNVVELKPERTDEPEVVQIDLQKADVVRMMLGTPCPHAPNSALVTIHTDLVRGLQAFVWNETALRAMPMRSLLQLYSDINWEKENPLGEPVILLPRKG